MSQNDSSLIRNCITVAVTAANKLVTMRSYLKWRHIVSDYLKFQMDFSPKLGSFQKNEGQIHNQWRQMY